ncbi:MAG: DHH family phosphoesterase [archaeon]|nr:MAG: DHH family phosphoesterase [archaeon]
MLDKIAEGLKKKDNYIILTHHNADVDAMASALALKKILEKLGKKARTGVAESISEVARKFASEDVETNPEIRGETIVVVDTSSPEQLEPIEVKEVFAVIDHHISGNLKASFSHIEPEANSCSQLIYRLSKKLAVEIEPETARNLVAGIVYDTAHLRRADPETFRILAELLEKSDKNYQEILEILKTEIDVSEKIAVLKSMKRLKSYRLGDVLLVTTSVGSFEASVARNLLRMGADIAIVGAPKKKGLRISGRMRWQMKERVNLAQVFSKIEKTIEGSAGGHDVAASANGKNPKNMGRAFREILGHIEKKLGEKAKEL